MNRHGCKLISSFVLRIIILLCYVIQLGLFHDSILLAYIYPNLIKFKAVEGFYKEFFIHIVYTQCMEM